MPQRRSKSSRTIVQQLIADDAVLDRALPERAFEPVAALLEHARRRGVARERDRPQPAQLRIGGERVRVRSLSAAVAMPRPQNAAAEPVAHFGPDPLDVGLRV